MGSHNGIIGVQNYEYLIKIMVLVALALRV